MKGDIELFFKERGGGAKYEMVGNHWVKKLVLFPGLKVVLFPCQRPVFYQNNNNNNNELIRTLNFLLTNL